MAEVRGPASMVTEIETVDDQYCFCLRLAGRDVVLFAFQTEKEARIAADALIQIAEHAVDILPAADAGTNDQAAAEVEPEGDEEQSRTDPETEVERPVPEADSPFLGR